MKQRQSTTRQTITTRNGSAQIIVVKKGSKMGKRGPKRKPDIVREPNGRASRDRRTTQQRLDEMAANDRRKIQSVVLRQPHRNGNDSILLGSALGRFCHRAGCKKETYDGVEAYAVAHKRWLIAIGKPMGFENVTLGGTTDGPTTEQIDRWKSRVDEVNRLLVRSFPGGIVGMVLRLCVDDIDLTADQFQRHHGVVRSALGEIAVCTGLLESNPHPFRG